ncbi:MAG TPA: glycosyltransferase [Acidobacteriaceae bacterium]|jgi:GT2 family glycosyltransferase|nr:glycosyltransferase [Acidobacteriaceae bacterium]
MAESGREAVSIFAVIVLYRIKPGDSATFRTLVPQAEAFAGAGNRMEILLYDNSPEGGDPGPLPGNVGYEAPRRNAGLAPAYNRGLAKAGEEGCDWLLTLDDDTTLPEDFLSRIAVAARRWQHDRSVAAIAPQLKAGEVLLSPIRVRPVHNVAVQLGFTGLNDGEIFALNSACLLRVSAIAELGGFPRQFWMNYLDVCLHHLLYRAGKRVYVAGDIQVEHKLSLLDYRNLSPTRYGWFLEAESAFFDLHKGHFAGAVLTATLMIRYLRHWVRRDSRELRRETARMLQQRLAVSREARIARWNAALEERYAQ